MYSAWRIERTPDATQLLASASLYCTSALSLSFSTASHKRYWWWPDFRCGCRPEMLWHCLPLHNLGSSSHILNPISVTWSGADLRLSPYKLVNMWWLWSQLSWHVLSAMSSEQSFSGSVPDLLCWTDNIELLLCCAALCCSDWNRLWKVAWRFLLRQQHTWHTV